MIRGWPSFVASASGGRGAQLRRGSCSPEETGNDRPHLRRSQPHRSRESKMWAELRRSMRSPEKAAWHAPIGVQIRNRVRSSGEGPVRRRTPVIIGFSFGEDCLIGAGDQKCGLNSGEACVHRRRQHGMRQSEFRSGIGCAAPARVLFAGGNR